MLSASDPITHEREIELAWAAGFFDGEGHVKFTVTDHAQSLSASVGQVHRATLERFQTAIDGGSIAFRPKSTGREYWVIEFYGRDQTLRLFRLLSPYLSEPKTTQFLNAFRGYNGRRKRRRVRFIEQIVGLDE